jgi:hypothetical protein
LIRRCHSSCRWPSSSWSCRSSILFNKTVQGKYID